MTNVSVTALDSFDNSQYGTFVKGMKAEVPVALAKEWEKRGLATIDSGDKPAESKEKATNPPANKAMTPPKNKAQGNEKAAKHD